VNLVSDATLAGVQCEYAVQGNHGEDVKELYFYRDSTPTHSYMSADYKYPLTEFPYKMLKTENSRRSLLDPEFELLDTGR